MKFSGSNSESGARQTIYGGPSKILLGLGLGYAPNNKFGRLKASAVSEADDVHIIAKGLAYQAIIGYAKELNSSTYFEAKARYAVLGKYKDSRAMTPAIFHTALLTLGIKKVF